MKYQRFSLALVIIAQLGYVVKAQQNPVDLYINSAVGEMGNTVKLDVNVNDFVDILTFQASINWDPNLLEYVHVSDFGLQDFNENSFGTGSVNLGHLRFVWTPHDGIAISEDDSTVLFSVSFRILSDQEQDVPIGYVDHVSDPAFIIEFANSNYEVLAVNTFDGNVNIVADLSDLVNYENKPNTSCDAKMGNGSLKVDVNGATNGYKFHWFKDSDIKLIPDHIGEHLENLFAGEYALQILTTEDDVLVEKLLFNIINAPVNTPDIISVLSNTPQSSCSTDPEKLTGSIEILVNDQQPKDTFNISWWKGSFDVGLELTDHKDANRAMNLDEGTYEVVVRNNINGCVAYHQETIEEALFHFKVNLASTDNNFCQGKTNGTVSGEVAETGQLNLRYYWFPENAIIDTTEALHRGPDYTGLSRGSYTSWVIDLTSECTTTGTVAVDDDFILPAATILQRNDTLYANSANANWYLNDIDMDTKGIYLVPSASGYYHYILTNDYNCSATSGSIYFGITDLEEEYADFKVYPNPFTDIISISNNRGEIDFVHIFDTQGAILKDINALKEKSIEIHLADAPQGYYVIRIGSGGIVHSQKVLKNLSK